MTTKILETRSDSQDLIRRAAFRLLLAHSAPIGVDQLAAATGINSARLSDVARCAAQRGANPA